MKIAWACALLLACGGGSSGGSFLLEWELTLDGAPADCLEVEVFDVEVVTTEAGGGSISETFQCEDGSAITTERIPGAYTITVNAIGILEDVLATSNDTGTIVDGQNSDLGTFPLTFGGACDSSSCPFGCCEGATCIEPQTDDACGRSGATCNDCTALGQTCNSVEGLCID